MLYDYFCFLNIFYKKLKITTLVFCEKTLVKSAILTTTFLSYIFCSIYNRFNYCEEKRENFPPNTETTYLRLERKLS